MRTIRTLGRLAAKVPFRDLHLGKIPACKSRDPRAGSQRGRAGKGVGNSPHGRWQIANLESVTTPSFWLVAGSLILVEAAIIVTALRMRVQPLAARSVVGRRPAEVVWTLLPALLLVALVVMSIDAS